VPAQTYVPQRAPGALRPSGIPRPGRPVGCICGLGRILIVLTFTGRRLGGRAEAQQPAAHREDAFANQEEGYAVAPNAAQERREARPCDGGQRIDTPKQESTSIEDEAQHEAVEPEQDQGLSRNPARRCFSQELLQG